MRQGIFVCTGQRQILYDDTLKVQHGARKREVTKIDLVMARPLKRVQTLDDQVGFSNPCRAYNTRTAFTFGESGLYLRLLAHSTVKGTFLRAQKTNCVTRNALHLIFPMDGILRSEEW